MILDPDVLEKLTDRQRPSAQARVLNKLGIPYRARPDGSLVVLVADVGRVQQTTVRPTVQLRCDAGRHDLPALSISTLTSLDFVIQYQH